MSQWLVTVRVGGCRRLQALSQTTCEKCTLSLKVDDSALIDLAQANPDRKVPTVPPPLAAQPLPSLSRHKAEAAHAPPAGVVRKHRSLVRQRPASHARSLDSVNRESCS